jgi:hypothetical protein
MAYDGEGFNPAFFTSGLKLEGLSNSGKWGGGQFSLTG